MNKLPWLKHNHDAHRDLWLRKMIRQNGHHFMTLWWTTIELLHWHGKGDQLKIDWRELADATQIRTSKLRDMFNHPDMGEKMIIVNHKHHVEIEIKNFRKIQEKHGAKNPLKTPQTTTDIEEEEEGEKKHTTDWSKFMDAVAVEYYGLKPGDQNSSEVTKLEAFYKRHGRDGKDAFAAAGKDPTLAIAGVHAIGERMDKDGLSWSLTAVANHMADYTSDPKGYEDATKKNR